MRDGTIVNHALMDRDTHVATSCIASCTPWLTTLVIWSVHSCDGKTPVLIASEYILLNLTDIRPVLTVSDSSPNRHLYLLKPELISQFQIQGLTWNRLASAQKKERTDPTSTRLMSGRILVNNRFSLDRMPFLFSSYSL